MEEVLMVRQERVSYTARVTVQVRSYEPVAVEVTVEKDVGKGETRDKVYAELKEWGDSKLGSVLETLQKAKTK